MKKVVKKSKKPTLAPIPSGVKGNKSQGKSKNVKELRLNGNKHPQQSERASRTKAVKLQSKPIAKKPKQGHQ